MRTEFRQRRSVLLSNFGQNKLIQLIAAIAMGFILIHGVKVIMIVLSDHPKAVFPNVILPAVALQPFPEFIKHPWTVLTYFWGHVSFLNLLSNMIWLYCFGSVLQTLIGFREIIPLYVGSCIVSALLFVGISFFWTGIPDTMILTALPGVVAFAVAAIVLAPTFRFHLGDRIAIPLWVVLVIFFLLNVLNAFHNTALAILLGGAGLSGALYIQLVKRGYHPGATIDSTTRKFAGIFNPEMGTRLLSKRRKETLKNLAHSKKDNSQEYIDKLLDKISQQGYDALTGEEKEALKKASEDIL